jgi:formate hydrogenlyase transcriptional activator
MPAMASSRPGSEPLNIQLLVDSIPALIHTSRPDGYLDYFNRPWLEYLGATLDKVVGWNWTAFIHPEDLDGIVATWRASLATGEIFEYETRVRRADGDYRWMYHHKAPLRDANGGIVKWYGSSLDIHERKTTEEQLRRNTQALRRSEFYLAEGQRLGHMGSWAFDPAGFDYWSPELFRMYGLDAASKAPSVQEYLGFIHPQDRQFMADLINRLVAEDTPFDATKRIVRPSGEVRYVRCVGVPYVGSQNLKKYVGSAIDVTEHELLTQELRRREAYMAEAQRLSRTGSFGWKPDTGEIVWSEETYRIFEYDRSVKPTIDSLVQRVHPEDRVAVKEVINRAFTGATEFDHAYRLLMTDGRVKHVHALAHVLRDASGNLEFVGAVTDISEQTMAEEALRSSEADLLEAQRLSHTGSWRNDVLTGIVTVSPEVHRIFEIGPGEDASTAGFFFGRIHPEDRPIEAQTFERASLAKTGFESDYRIVLPDGSIKHVHNVGHPVLNESGEITEFVGTVIDITERRHAEAVIREQEAELRQMLDFTPQLIGVYGATGERLYANRTALNYLGISLDEWRYTSFATAAHPDDSERLKAYADRAFSGGTADELELRIRKHDGSYRWFLARFNALRDKQGQITRWYSCGTDIEDRKQAEDRLRRENVALREEIDKTSMFEEIVGTSPALKSVLSRISKVARSDSTVLITGETGTGKELVARAIHRRSDRASRAFVSVNCAAIPRDLIASEFFGHEKGAFTGATQQRLGRFELANGGTIFLDEIGELPAETQIALLRVLQEHEFERVGGTRRIRVDVRVIAATNRDLEAGINAGSFRSDLFYRLNVFPIEIPSLRERRMDIPLLVEYFIDRYARKAGKNIKRVNKKTLELFQSYLWPGNIRELQNVIERSMILCESDIFSIDENWLPQPSPLAPESKHQAELPQRLVVQEKNLIEAALNDTRGRVSGPTGAAAKLGIPRSTLESKIRSLKINKNRFRAIPGT